MVVNAAMALLAIDSAIYWDSLVVAIAQHYGIGQEAADQWLALRVRHLAGD